MFYAKQEESTAWVTAANMGLLAARAPSLIRNQCQGTDSVCFQTQLSCQNILCYHLVWQRYLKVLTQTCLGDILWNILIGELISFPALLCNSESHLAGMLSSLAPVQHNRRARAPEEAACSQAVPAPSQALDRTVIWTRPPTALLEPGLLMHTAKHTLKWQFKILQAEIFCLSAQVSGSPFSVTLRVISRRGRPRCRIVPVQGWLSQCCC